MKNVFLCFILLFTVVGGIQAQVTDKEIADYHFNQGRYAEAKLYYDKLYETARSKYITITSNALSHWKSLKRLSKF